MAGLVFSNRLLGSVGVMLVASVGLFACSIMEGDGSQEPDSIHAGVKLQQAASEGELKRYLTAPFTRLNRQVMLGRGQEFDAPMESEAQANADAADMGSAGEAFSGTNNQVEGVNEGDIWKYDGEYFYVLKPASYTYGACVYSVEPAMQTSELSVSDPEPCDTNVNEAVPASVRVVHRDQTEVNSLELSGIRPSELYLSGDKLAVIGNQQALAGDWGDYRHWQRGSVALRVVDVADPLQPQTTLDIHIDGYMVKSRRIGEHLYIVSRFSPDLSGIVAYPQSLQEVEANKAKVADITAAKLLPTIAINGLESPLLAGQACWLTDMPTDYWGAPTLTLISRINISTGELESRCMGGEVEGLYMSASSLYLYTTSYWDFSADLDDAFDDDGFDDDGLGDDEFDNSDRNADQVGFWSWNSGNTHLHKFDLSDLSYEGSAVVKGAVGWNHSSFRFGELADGRLGLVTSDRSASWDQVKHRLTVLESQAGELMTVAQLPNEQFPNNIGKPGEDIYSVRFMQNRAYIVTFQKTDPLYVIDLSDSGQPRIAGELEIPGFSDYLHPIGENLLLGMGKDVQLGQSGRSWNQGVKVSLFNVADIAQPSELGSLIIGKRGSYSELAYDHHAFTGIQQGLGLERAYRFAFPISVSDGEPRYLNPEEPESQYYPWQHTGLYLFEVKDQTLSAEGALITDRASEGGAAYERGGNTRRGLIQGDEVYHLKGSAIYRADWQQPDQAAGPF